MANKKRVQKSADPLKARTRCTAKSKRTGKPCQNAPMNGQAVCRMHGGATKAARAKAQERILAAADLAAKHLIEFMTSKRVPYPTRLAATREILDRAGISDALRVEIQTSGSIDRLIESILFDVDDKDHEAKPTRERRLPGPRPTLPAGSRPDSGASAHYSDDWPPEAWGPGGRTAYPADDSGGYSSEQDDDDVLDGVVLNGDDAPAPHPPHPYNRWRRPAPGAPGW
ncbi:MAG TPA: HGGxSTG domain-containing protein [Streptosporangiaceae bacterium]|nr:HGGxSTG domain-containing protein [Streptosporangiaceae bacterium]